jgi:hypothetical protein
MKFGRRGICPPASLLSPVLLLSVGFFGKRAAVDRYSKIPCSKLQGIFSRKKCRLF